jgi:hypothetical protein
MKGSVLVMMAALVVCGAGFGVYYGYASVVRRELEAELGRARDSVIEAKARHTSAENRLRSVGLELVAAEEEVRKREAEREEFARREEQLTVGMAGIAHLHAQVVRERELYKGTLAAMINSPVTPIAVRDEAVGEMQRRAREMGEKLGWLIERARSDVRVAEGEMRYRPGEREYEVYRWRLLALKELVEQASLVGADVDSFAEANASHLGNAAIGVRAQVAMSRVVLKEVAGDVEEVDGCLAARRTCRCRVRADGDWQASGLTLAEGESVAIATRGTWVWSSSADSHALSFGGARGGAGAPDQGVVEEISVGALLLRVRGVEGVYPGWGNVQPLGAGEVEFRINDRKLEDNRGAIEVEMWVVRPLPGK